VAHPPLHVVLAQLAAKGVALPPGRVRLDAYGNSPDLSRALIELIIEGRKRAGTALLWSFEHEGEPLPEVGDIEIVLDHTGVPALITRVVRVEVLPFDEVGAEYAAIEGEGDGSLTHWRAVHQDYFDRECARIGRGPDAAMPVVCSVFEVVATVPSGERSPRRDCAPRRGIPKT
jgi:uncharacterized protein YhfF